MALNVDFENPNYLGNQSFQLSILKCPSLSPFVQAVSLRVISVNDVMFSPWCAETKLCPLLSKFSMAGENVSDTLGALQWPCALSAEARLNQIVLNSQKCLKINSRLNEIILLLTAAG